MASLTQQEYADVLADPAQPNPNWDEQQSLYTEYTRYFYGDVFEDTVRRKTGEEPSEVAILYPLRINLIRMMCFTHLQMFLGQWEDNIFDFIPRQSKRGERLDLWAEDATNYIYQVWDESSFNSRVMDAALAMMIYGGAIFKAAFDPTLGSRMRIDHVLPEYFYPRWHPMNPDELLEATIHFTMSVEDAKLAYNYQTDGSEGDTVSYIETWTKDRVHVSVGGKVLAQFSGPNPYPFIPFVYIPRIRSPGDFYGIAVPHDIMGLCDEINMRLSDVGDRIQYSAHPQWVVANFAGNTKQWEIGGDNVINLGTGLAGLEPTLKSLDPVGEPGSTFKYIDFLLDLSRMSAMSPPVAFGTDEGSQRSALTLAFRMWPLVQQSKVARLNWTTGLMRLHDMIIRSRLIRDKDRTNDTVPTTWMRAKIIPKWSPILPRDRMEIVKEVMDAWNLGEDPLVSPEAAINALDFTEDPEAELQAVRKLWSERDGREQKLAKMAQKSKEEAPKAQPSSG